MLEPILERPAFRRDFELWDQINRAVNSPCPNIAEGFSRFYPRDNARFVRIAKGSLSELLVHLPRAVRKKFVSEEEAALATSLARRARGAVIGYLVYLENCPPRKPPSERPQKPPGTQEPGTNPGT